MSIGRRAVDTVERVLTTGRAVSQGPLPNAARGMNGIPTLVRVTDPVDGMVIEAVQKPAVAQAAQEAFAWQAARQLNVDDLVTVAARRFDLGGSVLIERAPGLMPASPSDIARVASREDLHRLLAFDYVLANSDRHLLQMFVNPSQGGLLAFDHGHIGVGLKRTKDVLTAPMHDALFAAAGVQVPVGIERRAALMPEAIKLVAHNVDKDELYLAHAKTLANTARVRGAAMPRADRFARSNQYIDGVMERLDALQATGEIRYLNSRIT